MSCFSCFSSQEKKATKRSNSSSREQLPPTILHGEPPLIPQSRPENSKPKPSPPTDEAISHYEPAELNKEAGKNNIVAQTFTFRDLATTTKNFRQECLIGEGGFGRVYKGKLEKTNLTVAVKQLDRNGLQGNREFLVEVLMLSLLHHQNLVKLIGYCADGDQRLLVYEYMPLGSLEDHLLDLPPNQMPLDWYTRMKIALGAAKGLEYLHDKANPPVIYRDLKSSNILLDKEYNAKLSDFGLAKLGPLGDKTHVSSRIMGTYGYCAPEYQRTGQLTVKSDVYSFGVVLLELVTGRRAIDTMKPTEEQNLVSWAYPIFKDPNRYSELADENLEGDFPVRGLNQAVAVTIMCLNEEQSARPLMSDVVTALSFLGIDQEQGGTAYDDDDDNNNNNNNNNLPHPPTTHNNQNNTYRENDDRLNNQEKESLILMGERQRAVEEAMEWGSNSRHNAERNESYSSQ